MELGLLVVRVVVGLLFVGHGAQKLFGAFGGGGLAGTASFFESIGLRPGHLHARAAGVAELTAGVLLVLGVLTPLAAAMITAVMVVAIATVHGSNGLWATENGCEYNLVLIATAFAVVAVGPGVWSLDSALGVDGAGAGWALAALAAGILGAIATVIIGRRVPAEQRRSHRPAAQH